MLVRMHRRALLALSAQALLAASTRARAGSDGLQFPRDHGAHPAQRTEWWYLTGSLQADAPGPAQIWGFQVTFFRSATGLPLDARSRFAARELVFAHVALTDLAQRRLRHDQSIARAGFGIAQASEADAQIVLRDWSLARSESGYRAIVASDAARFGFELNAATTQPLLLQGDAGISRKGPLPDQVSRYYSEPQLAIDGTLRVDGRALQVRGRAWLDHEWSDAFMPPQAVGWDWIGMNLDDGSALTAFRLRRADGSSVYAGGSFRPRGEASRSFADGDVQFAPGRVWQSTASKTRYPVEWTVSTPAGTFKVAALLDDQELDSRTSTGSIYWEGLSDLLDAQGGRVGRGYLEMTGYAAALKL
jgi:predicted secreted hydrolase